jgi:hypothetical protein
MNQPRLVVVLLVAALAIGCDKPIEQPSPIALEKIPPPILKIARETLPEVKLESAVTGKSDGVEAYEIRGRDERGKTREVKVSASGKVLEVE